jgi:sugar O-acyltransferase (sialic acid O-acetyltransferase NeuD family)
MKKPILLFGSSGHAKVVIDAIEKENKYEIVGLIDSYREINEFTLGYPVLGNESVIDDFLNKSTIHSIFIAVGDNWSRKTIFEQLNHRYKTIQFPSIIHPSSTLAKGVIVGKGSLLLAGSIVNSESTIGDFCIINTKASVDHDCSIGNFSSLAPGVTLGGKVVIGSLNAIGIGALLRNNINVGNNNVIGMGANIIHDVKDNSVVFGNPGKLIKFRESHEKYL